MIITANSDYFFTQHFMSQSL